MERIVGIDTTYLLIFPYSGSSRFLIQEGFILLSPTLNGLILTFSILNSLDSSQMKSQQLK